MYYLFKEKNILPGEYYNLSLGEKLVIRAFFEFDMDIRSKNKKEEETNNRLNRLRKK